MKHLLATAIGQISARESGLAKIVLPISLPISFRHQLKRAVDNNQGVAFVVGDRIENGEEISPEQAISFRTHEKFEESSIILISTEGHSKDLKSLEAFRDLLSSGLPGGLKNSSHACLHMSEISSKTSKLSCELAGKGNPEKLETAVAYIADYLSQAYEEIGNDAITWVSAFWFHLDRFIDRLPSLLRTLNNEHPKFETLCGFAAAGLPYPDGELEYRIENNAKKLKKIIAERWLSLEQIERTLIEMAEIRNSSSHPLQQLDWETFSNSQANLGHPLLAVTHHAEGELEKWQNAWAETSEVQFFYASQIEVAEIQVEILADNTWQQINCLKEWKPSVFILPPPERNIIDKNLLEVGLIKVVVTVKRDLSGKRLSFELESIPKSSAEAKLISTQLVSANAGQDKSTFECQISLARKMPVKRGQWREKLFSLCLSPTRDSTISLLPLKVNLFLPHPARSSILIGEKRGALGTMHIRQHGGTIIKTGNGEVCHVPSRELPAVPLAWERSTAQLITISSEATEIQADGLECTSIAPRAHADNFRSDLLHMNFYDISNISDDATIRINDFSIKLTRPISVDGYISPIWAAVTGDPLRTIEGDARAELYRDPRALLEEWYAHKCIVTNCREINFRESLGTIILSINQLGSRIKWSQRIQAFINFTEQDYPGIPRKLVSNEKLRNFWQAFDSLDLKSLSEPVMESAWPSALDLRRLEKGKLVDYLEAYSSLVDKPDNPWAAYPFSAALYDVQRGDYQGILLSPLHPIRLAWNWSAQQAGELLTTCKVFGSVSKSFLRFIDGSMLPVIAPSLTQQERWLSIMLSLGREEFFAAWAMLAIPNFQERYSGLKLLGLELSFGAPSGLDSGGVLTAIRDYMRIYPTSAQLRVGFYAPREHERYLETDEAVIAAVIELLSNSRDDLPGGIRIFDSGRRRGNPPNPERVLKRLQEMCDSDQNLTQIPAFEWLSVSDDEERRMDLQFMEDSVVELRIGDAANDSVDEPGSVGPDLPLGRYKIWKNDGRANQSKIMTSFSPKSFSKLENFKKCLALLEAYPHGKGGAYVSSSLPLGRGFASKMSRWTITGNRHLDPAALSGQLSDALTDLVLWEWRPAFLTREQNKGLSPLSSSHPYTILARLTPSLKAEINTTLHKCGVDDEHLSPDQIIRELGMRGIGLSSLLTMGHAQSMGALGFYAAYKTLAFWEQGNGTENEVRSILPMDAVFPLLDVLGIGSEITDDQRRADLLLIKATHCHEPTPSVILHPVEIKARSSRGPSFPRPASVELRDSKEQLAATCQILKKVIGNLNLLGGGQPLVNAAMAVLIETSLILKPYVYTRKIGAESRLLEAVGSGIAQITSSPGTLLWFQSKVRENNGKDYSFYLGRADEPGQLIAGFAVFSDGQYQMRLSEKAAEIIDGAMQIAQDECGNSSDGNEQLALGAKLSKNDAPLSMEDNFSSNLDEKAHEGQDIAGSGGINILVGTEPVVANDRPVYFKPSETALNQLNIGVVGDLGTGKTQFLKSLAYQLSQSKNDNRGHAPKIFIFDYKRDYTNDPFVSAVNARVLDPAKTLPLNFFTLPPDASQVDQVRRANFFVDLLRKLSMSNIGQVQQNTLYRSIMEAYENCRPGHCPLLAHIFEVYRRNNNNKEDSVTSVLMKMVDLQIFETREENICTFADLFTQTIVLDLASLSGAGESIEHILATMFLDHLYTDYMKTRQKQPFLKGDDGVSRRFIDSFILIDEAHHAMKHDFNVLINLMLEGREFGMGVILSSQYLSHFEKGQHDWTEALSTWVVHNVRNARPRDFERIGFRRNTRDMADHVSNLEPHWAYFRCTNGYSDGFLIKGQPFFSLVS